MFFSGDSPHRRDTTLPDGLDYVFGMRDMDRIKFFEMGKHSGCIKGIVLTNLNIFPLNIIVHGTGAFGWTVAGYLTKDRALLTNFCLQLPIFAFGIINYGAAGTGQPVTRGQEQVGGANRDRTDDLNAIVALSQLSYGPT